MTNPRRGGPAVHLKRTTAHGELPECGAYTLEAMLTDDPDLVTCRMCRRSRKFRDLAVDDTVSTQTLTAERDKIIAAANRLLDEAVKWRREADRRDRMRKRAENDAREAELALARARDEAEELRSELDRLTRLDDSKHRPRTPDPLTVGPARVTGTTAKVVSRGKTLTRHEYERRNTTS